MAIDPDYEEAKGAQEGLNGIYDALVIADDLRARREDQDEDVNHSEKEKDGAH